MVKKTVFALILIVFLTSIQSQNGFSNSSRTDLNNIENGKTVFGYLPDYFMDDYKNLIRYDLLTHIAVFPFNADSNGIISLPAAWPWTDVINNAHLSGTKIIATVTNYNPAKGFFDQDILNKLVSDSAVKNVFFTNCATIIKNNNIDGINLDFENIITSELWNSLAGFVLELKKYLAAEINYEVEVSFASPSVNWGSYDFELMAGSCDYLFIMAYDYYWKASPVTGPVAPVVGGWYNVSSSLLGGSNIPTQYEIIINSNPEKLILGIPLYGYIWQSESPSPGDSTLSIGEPVFYYQNQLKLDSLNVTPVWDELSRNYYAAWQDGTTWNQFWFDNLETIGAKIDLAHANKIKGIGFWSLGYDAGDEELWAMVSNKLQYVGVASASAEFPEEFTIYPNYPNPFNPSTNIRFSIPEDGDVSLTIINVAGEMIKREKINSLSAGMNDYKFIAGDIAAGVYFYRIVFKNKKGRRTALTGKMILLK